MRDISKPIYTRRIQKIWEESQQNTIKINDLNKIRKKLEPVQFIKHKRKIEVVDFLIEDSYAEYNFQKTFIDFAEWGINQCKVVCEFYTPNGNYIGGLFEGFSQNFYYTWKKSHKTTKTYTLLLTVENIRNTNPHPDIPTSVIETPVYCKIDVVFYNKRIYHEIQHRKT